MTGESARALLAGLVDYAGLFPPAGLTLEDAAAEYARWRRSSEAWMLGRFVLPATRLAELPAACEAHLPDTGDDPWRLSALLGSDTGGDAALVDAFDRRGAGRAFVETVELKAASPGEAEAALGALRPGPAAYVEIPLDVDLEPVLAAIRARGGRAKVRTGGVVPEAIPDTSALARFLVACAGAGVPFKATAGLHHPVRSEQALTYEGDAPRAVMHGFLNVFTAAVLAQGGAPAGEVDAVLREEANDAFRFDGDGLRCRGRLLTTAALAESRRAFAISFGSCSFAEPLADLRSLGVLP